MLVKMYDANYGMHQETARVTTKTLVTVVLKVSARMIDVESGVVLAEPSRRFRRRRMR